MTTQFEPAEALAILDALHTESGIEPTATTTARNELAGLAEQKAKALAELAATQKPTDVDALAEAIANGDHDTSAAIAAALARKDAKEYKRLVNRVSWVFDRRARAILVQLGDQLIADIFAPWMDRTIAEFAPHAHVVVEHGHRSAKLERDPHQHDYNEAERLTAQAHRIWRHAATLRAAGVLSNVGDGSDPRWLTFGAPHRLAAEDKAHREAWWLAYAVTNGAKPGVYSGHLAELAQRAVPA